MSTGRAPANRSAACCHPRVPWRPPARLLGPGTFACSDCCLAPCGHRRRLRPVPALAEGLTPGQGLGLGRSGQFPAVLHRHLDIQRFATGISPPLRQPARASLWQLKPSGADATRRKAPCTASEEREAMAAAGRGHCSRLWGNPIEGRRFRSPLVRDFNVLFATLIARKTVD